jgi:hypothetical protein
MQDKKVNEEGRKAWSAPELRCLSAGSAEARNSTSDMPDTGDAPNSRS